ncbi:MAG: hypothetical protein C0614_06050 [Desulfuromonas sp.]|nr:MAG: hypothetical protein C0614_06050 [Desulfuromonas sp.]
MKGLLSYSILIPVSIFLGLAPFIPQPHLAEKIAMIIAGELSRPIDIFDLFWHSWPIVLLGYRVASDLRAKRRK